MSLYSYRTIMAPFSARQPLDYYRLLALLLGCRRYLQYSALIVRLINKEVLYRYYYIRYVAAVLSYPDLRQIYYTALYQIRVSSVLGLYYSDTLYASAAIYLSSLDILGQRVFLKLVRFNLKAHKKQEISYIRERLLALSRLAVKAEVTSNNLALIVTCDTVSNKAIQVGVIQLLVGDQRGDDIDGLRDFQTSVLKELSYVLLL